MQFEEGRKACLFLILPCILRAEECRLLYLISYMPRRYEKAGETPFFDAIARLGETRELFEGCVFLNAAFTAIGIRRRLLEYARDDDRFVITQVYQNHCAGKLTDGQKEFLREHVSPDPFDPPPDIKPYSF